ncbi:hypothetical protein B0H11DRAFT_1907533 [Mycena galericulata]|nr:hypothetical protein B0H11DRAFT_1907533 [Mycena galericulata]
MLWAPYTGRKWNGYADITQILTKTPITVAMTFLSQLKNGHIIVKFNFFSVALGHNRVQAQTVRKVQRGENDLPGNLSNDSRGTLPLFNTVLHDPLDTIYYQDSSSVKSDLEESDYVISCHAVSRLKPSGLRLEEYKGSFKSNWTNPYPYDGIPAVLALTGVKGGQKGVKAI